MSGEITVRVDEQTAADMHIFATRILESWGDEEGFHVEGLRNVRRSLESGLRAHGWEPTAEGIWTFMPSRRRR